MSFRLISSGLYRDLRTGHFFERPTIGGRRTWRKIDARTAKVAKEILAARKTDLARFEAGLASDPYATGEVTLGTLLDEYKKAHCPYRNTATVRSSKQLKQETSRVDKLVTYFVSFKISELRILDFTKYWEFRKGQMAKGRHGGRAVDLELVTLRNVFRWAVATQKIPSIPLAGVPVPRFRRKEISHARDRMPKNAAELHQIATHFFEDSGSAVLGWQVLMQAFTGARTSELRLLRWDAGPRQPGYVEGDWLWMQRSKGGVNPFALIHPALRECLAALRRWSLKHAKGNPYMLPSPRGKGPVGELSLTAALRRAAPLLGIQATTSHGLRAYYVTVRRSQGISDAQIAAEIGDKTGAEIIIQVYGAVPPNWQGLDGMTWLPDGEAAWKFFSGIPAGLSNFPSVATGASDRT